VPYGKPTTLQLRKIFEPDSFHKLYFLIGWSHSRLQMGSSEEGQNPEQSPKMSSGFQCFVCGKQFGTNGEKSILKKLHMVVCMILHHLRKERTLDDFNNLHKEY
jgi:hypothetical protein